MISFASRPRLIVYRLGSLGDTIVALPCFHAIRRQFPEHEILVLTNKPVESRAAPLLSVLGTDGQFIDGTIEYTVSVRRPAALITLGRQLRAIGADRCIYLMPQRSRSAILRDAAFLRWVGGQRKLLAMPSSEVLRTAQIDPETGLMEPEAARLARCCADFADIDLEDRRNWDLKLTKKEIAKADALLQTFSTALGESPFAVINMGGKAIEKDWGLENWLKLRERIAAGGLDPLGQGPWGLMVVGAAEDSAQADAFLSGWAGPALNACGRLSPRESGAAMRNAQVFIGHDSGPLHLAASVGLASIGLFGDYNRPKLWHPLGRHVRIIHRMDGLACITPDHILEQAIALNAIRGSI